MVNCTDQVASQPVPLSWLVERGEERISCGYTGHVRYWHLADSPTAPAFVRYWSNSGTEARRLYWSGRRHPKFQ